jgi:hypothetical protein
MGDMADYMDDVVIDLLANGDETEGMYEKKKMEKCFDLPPHVEGYFDGVTFKVTNMDAANVSAVIVGAGGGKKLPCPIKKDEFLGTPAADYADCPEYCRDCQYEPVREE